MFPYELLIKGRIKYIFFIVFQSLLVTFIGRAFINRKKNAITDDEEEEENEDEKEVATLGENVSENKEEADIIEEIEEEEEKEETEEEKELRLLKEEDRRLSRTSALYLYLAFLLCSAAFEPDFGSWIRHQGVALPIILLIL